MFFFLFGVVISVGITCLGFAAHNAYVPNWFVLRRGLAFGVVSAAGGAGNMLASPYHWLISRLGWRLAYAVLAAINVVVVIPLAGFVIRRTPREKGLLPDGVTDNSGVAGSGVPGQVKLESLIVPRP